MTATQNFSEWQLPNFSSFLPHLLITPAIWATLAPFSSTLGISVGILLTLATIALRIAMAKRITVDDTGLHSGKASIPIGALGKVELIDARDILAARNASSNAAAFLQLKSGLPVIAKIEIVDANDATPYVLIQCRKADELKSAIEARTAVSKKRARKA